MLKGQAWPALRATGRIMGSSSLTFAAVGGIFAAVDVRSSVLTLCSRSFAARVPTRLTRTSAQQCLAEGARGKKDVWNGVLGGAAAGSVIGVRGAFRCHGLSPRLRLTPLSRAAASLGVGVGASAALAAMSAAIDASGQQMRGERPLPCACYRSVC